MRDFKGLPSRAAHPLAWVLLSVYLIACPVLAQSLEIIDLKYRTAAEVIPVIRADGRVIGTGKPGPISLRMIARFREITREGGTPIYS